MYCNKNSDPPEIAGEIPDFPIWTRAIISGLRYWFFTQTNVITIKLFGTFDKCTGSTLAGTGARSQNGSPTKFQTTKSQPITDTNLLLF